MPKTGGSKAPKLSTPKARKPEKRKRQQAVLELVRQEVEMEDIVDLIIRGGFHKPPAPIDPLDTAAVERFRLSTQRLIYYDLRELVADMTCEQAVKRPLYAAIYEQQQQEIYTTARKRWLGLASRGVATTQADRSQAGQIMMEASRNLASVRGVDINAKQKHEFDVGERLAKATRTRIGEFWQQFRKQHPTLPSAQNEPINVTAKPQAPPLAADDDDDDAGTFN